MMYNLWNLENKYIITKSAEINDSVTLTRIPQVHMQYFIAIIKNNIQLMFCLSILMRNELFTLNKYSYIKTLTSCNCESN